MQPRAVPRSPKRGAAPAATIGASHLAAIPYAEQMARAAMEIA